ncbi:MAG TPA: amino acid permease [Sphingomicrobium sp.]
MNLDKGASAEEAPQLARSLLSRHVSMIAIGGIIGAGLFVGSSTSIATVGPAVIVSYLLAGLIVLLVMRMLSEMAVAVPGVQSFPEFARVGLGDWAGFMSGWLYWYFWVVVVAIEAIAGAAIIRLWLPAFQVWEIGVVLMAALTAVNLLSARLFGEFEFWFSSLKVGAIIAFIVIAASFAFGVTSPAGPTFSNLSDHGGFAPFGWVAMLAGVTSVIFALTGAEIATVAAAESADPARTIARISVTVAVRILIFYILSVALIVSVVPWTSIIPGQSPFATALVAMNVPGAAHIMNAIVLVAVLSCLNSGLYVTSRVLFALAARGDAPQSLVAVGRRRVPARAILVGSLFSYGALAAAIVSPQTVFSFLVNASGAIMLAIYLMIAAAQLRLRGQLEREAPERLTIRMWFHPWGSILAIIGIVAVMLAMAVIPALASQFYASLIVIAIVGAAFLGLRRYRRTRSADTSLAV